LESAYAACLKYELIERGLKVACEVPLPVIYEGVKLDAGYRLDLVVEVKKSELDLAQCAVGQMVTNGLFLLARSAPSFHLR